MQLAADLDGIAAQVAAHDDTATVSAVLAVEPAPGVRRYLCAFERADGSRSWLVVGEEGEAVTSRREVRDTVSVAALCELAEECAFPGDLDELRSQLVALRLTESPAGIDEAEDAALALQHVLGAPPPQQLASLRRLDQIGVAARRLERSLDPIGTSPFASAMEAAQGVVDELWTDVEATYLSPLE